MRIDKAQVLDIMRSLGKDTSVAETELPDQVDTDEHTGLLGKFGISGGELLAQFGGGSAGREDGDESEAVSTEDNDLVDGVPIGIVGLRGVGHS